MEFFYLVSLKLLKQLGKFFTKTFFAKMLEIKLTSFMGNITFISLFIAAFLFVFFAAFSGNTFLWIISTYCLWILLGFFLKKWARSCKKTYRRYLITAHVIILEPMAIFFVYLLSFLSFFKGPFNIRSNKTPIVLVHGYINFASVWLYHLLRLRKKGYGPIYLINLGYPFSGIETYAKKLKKKIDEVQRQTKKKDVILIGHSMGGLVSSYYAVHNLGHAKIHAIITLGSPLKGTKIAKIGIGKCCRQMEINSSFLNKLQKKYPKDLYYHIVTKKDQLVVPYTSGLIHDISERQYTLGDLGHCSLLYSQRVTKKIEQWLQQIT